MQVRMNILKSLPRGPWYILKGIYPKMMLEPENTT